MSAPVPRPLAKPRRYQQPGQVSLVGPHQHKADRLSRSTAGKASSSRKPRAAWVRVAGSLQERSQKLAPQPVELVAARRAWRGRE